MARKKKRKKPDQSSSDDSAKQKKLERKEYEKELEHLQTELCHLQAWVKKKGLRVVVVFEGRDAAGKGGVIRALTERVSPRVFRVNALPAPSDREKTQLHGQRYLALFPAAGEIAIFDRSWYNRAGVEKVLGFCTGEETRRFLQVAPHWERMLVSGGIILFKYWLEVSHDEQRRRFERRIDDPMRQWKLSPTDLESVRKWYDYSLARDVMFEATDIPEAPWHLIRSDDKKRARLNMIRHFLDQFDYKRTKPEKPTIPPRAAEKKYDDVASLKDRKWIPERY